MLLKYIPLHFVSVHQKIKKNGFIRINGTVMFADLSGFTNMSEKLTAKGKEGSEEISKIINSVFEELISEISRSGGSVYKFGGDALTVFFPDNISVSEVISCSVRMQDIINNFAKIKTIAGTFSVKMKIGIAYGESVIGHLGKEQDRQYFIAGDTLDKACECEHASEKGEILFTGTVKDHSGTDTVKKKKNFFVLDIEKFRKSGSCTPASINDKIPKDRKWFANYIDDELIRRENAGTIETGELRNCAVIFLNFEGVEYGKDFDYGLLDSFYTLVWRTVKKYQGFVNKIDMGDKGNKIIMLFGAPVSTEKNEEFALRAVQEISSEKPEGINIRTGVNNGNIYFGVAGASHRREFTVIGNTVNLSARLMASAGNNEIIISSAVKKRVPETVTGDERKLQLKGVNELFSAYPFEKVLETRKSKRFKLIGREKEQEQYKKLLNSKKVACVNIKAEAGLGKSVLVNKLFEERTSKNKCFLVNCLSYTKNNPYFAVKEFITKFCGSGFLDDEKTRISKLRLIMKKIGEEENTELFAEFIGWKSSGKDISDPGLRNFFSEVSLTVFNHFINVEHAALFIEDAHWMDSASALFFKGLLELTEPEKVPVQLHFVYRPEKKMEPFEKDGRSAALELNNLGKNEGLEFIKAKFNLVSVPKKIYTEIYQKTKGNPFFMEEILLSLKNNGDLIPQKQDSKTQEIKEDSFMSERDRELARFEKQDIKYRIKPSIKQINIPDNVNDMVLARIDKLDENSKTVLKIASVIGRVFQIDILKQLQDLKEIADQLDIKDSLFDLTKVDLTIFEESGENEYLFKHAITREVAYETLLYSLRRKYHLRIARLYEERFGDDIANAYELLAFHYRHTADKDKAKYYLLRSAESARNKFSFKEAFDFLKMYRKYKMPPREKLMSYFIDIEILKISEKRKKAISVCDRIMKKSHEESDIYQKATVKKINLYRRGGEYSKAARLFIKVKKFSDPDTELEALIEAATSFLLISDDTNFRKTFSRMKKLLSITTDSRLKVWGYSLQAVYHNRKREFDKAVKLSKKMIGISEKENFISEKLTALQNMAGFYAQTGNMDKAGETYEKVYLEAKKIHNYNILLRGIDGLSKVSYIKGEFKKAEKYIKDGIKLVNKTGKSDLKELLLEVLFNIKLETGKYDEALTIISQREELIKKMNKLSRLTVLNDHRGDVFYRKGDLIKALDIYKANLISSEKTGDIRMVVHSYGNIANCYADTGKVNESLLYYRKQIENAVKIKDVESHAKALYNMAYTYFEEKELDSRKALELALEAKDICSKAGIKNFNEYIETLINDIKKQKIN